MKFCFNVFNHCEDGRRCIEDLTRILSAQLRALGHEATEGERFASDGYNVLYESFADLGTIDAIAAAHDGGARFLYVATEEPTAEGCFNGRLDNAMDARQEAFSEAARYADGILHLVPGERVTEWYSRYAPAAYVELGYAGSLVADTKGEQDPPIAFGFYGQMTPRREAIFEKLRRATGWDILILPFITYSSAERDVMMRQTRAILQVRAHDSMPIVSSSRCATALHLGRPVVGEPHDVEGPWGGIVHLSASTEAFYSDAKEVASDWRSEHSRQMDRFSTVLSPETCLGEPLRRLGIV